MRIEERVVAVEVEQALVHVHAASRLARHGLGHERGVHAVLQRYLLHHQLVRHHRVGHGQRIGEAQIYLVLRGPVLVVAVLHGDAHLLQCEHRVAAQVGGVVEAREVEVAAAVEHLGALGPLEVVELQLGAHVEHIAHLPGLPHRARQHLARIAFERQAVGRAHVAEHAGDRVGLRAPGQHLERGGIGIGEHVGFLRAAEPLDAAAVEAHAVGERVLELARHDGERLHGAQHVGEPEAHEVHVAALDGLEEEVLVGVRGHGRILSLRNHYNPRCFGLVTQLPGHAARRRESFAPLACLSRTGR